MAKAVKSAGRKTVVPNVFKEVSINVDDEGDRSIETRSNQSASKRTNDRQSSAQQQRRQRQRRTNIGD